MINKYLVPIAYEDDAWIEVIHATSIEDARDKLIDQFINEYDLDCPDTWVDFTRWMWEHNYAVGEPTDAETL